MKPTADQIVRSMKTHGSNFDQALAACFYAADSANYAKHEALAKLAQQPE